MQCNSLAISHLGIAQSVMGLYSCLGVFLHATLESFTFTPDHSMCFVVVALFSPGLLLPRVSFRSLSAFATLPYAPAIVHT